MAYVSIPCQTPSGVTRTRHTDITRQNISQAPTFPAPYIFYFLGVYFLNTPLKSFKNFWFTLFVLSMFLWLCFYFWIFLLIFYIREGFEKFGNFLIDRDTVHLFPAVFNVTFLILCLKMRMNFEKCLWCFIRPAIFFF